MSYGLIYKIPFAALRGEACMIEIELEGYTGAATELTAADSPFTVEIDDEEFLYTPTRFSNATIRVVGSDYLQSLFSTAYQQYRVTFKREGEIVWCGFIKPEVYTQDYCSDKFELELECMSAMSTLEYINYQADKEERQFVSLWSLLQKCIQSANGQYNAVYLPHVYASSAAQYNAGENVLEKMTVSEQNFFDEDDEAMSLKEILEETCKLLNWTCCDWCGELYFVDIDHSEKYYKYDGNLSGKTGETTDTLLNVQTVGFAGTGHALDMLPGYNKATVRVSNYCVGQIFPEEDYNKLKEFSGLIKTQVKDKVTVKKFYYPDVYKLYQYSRDEERGEIPTMILEMFRLNPNDILGAMPIKRSDYKLVDGKPDITNYSWEDLIQVRRSFNTNLSQVGYLYLSEKKILSFKKPLPVTSYPNGAFAIDFSIQLTGNEDLTVDDKRRTYTPYIECSLYIGNYYYNGSSWTTSEGRDKFRINVPFNNASGFVSCENTKTLEMPYDGLNGFIIPLPSDKVLVGELKFDMYIIMPKGTEGINFNKEIKGYYIKDLKMQYAKKEEPLSTSDNSDRYYENVVNESYINELDEIEFKISSYNNDGACYSKVMLGDKYLESNLYASVVEELIRPEELLIRRIVNRYDVPRIKLTQTIQETSELTPITRLSDNFMVNKIFINAGGSIDYKMGQFRCVMIEI